MRENTLVFVDFIISKTYVFILLGLFHLLYRNYNNLYEISRNFLAKKKNPVTLTYPLLKDLSHIVLGFLVILMSFSIVNTIITNFLAIDTNQNFTSIEYTGLLASLKTSAEYTGLFSTMGIIASGYCLILSAGSKWLKTLAKLFFTLSILYLFLGSLFYNL